MWVCKYDIERNMMRVGGIVNKVAAGWRLSLEHTKHGYLRLGKRKKNPTAKANWLGDKSLTFESHLKKRIEKARRMVGTLGGMGRGDWGISPMSWRHTYTKVIQTMSLWGAGLGWSEQKDWGREFNRLQYRI